MKYNRDYKTIDPIDRNESIRRFEYMRELTADQVVEMLERVPSCRPKGEWEEVDSWESEEHSVTDMRCSLCGKYASIVLPHGNRYVYDFCPNCGAKMNGERR